MLQLNEFKTLLCYSINKYIFFELLYCNNCFLHFSIPRGENWLLVFMIRTLALISDVENHGSVNRLYLNDTFIKILLDI